MVDPPNFVNPFADPREQKRLAEMTRNPVSSRPKVDMENLKEQLITKVTMPVFAPEEGWHVTAGTRSRQTTDTWKPSKAKGI